MNGKDAGIGRNAVKHGMAGLFRKNAILPDPGNHPGPRAAVPVCAEARENREIREARARYQWNR